MSVPRLFCQHQYRPDMFREYELNSSPIRIGSQPPQANVVLESNYIPPLTAELVREDSTWVLRAACSGIVALGAATLERDEREPMYDRCQFRLNEWLCELRLPSRSSLTGPKYAEDAGALLKAVHSALLQQKSISLKSREDAQRESPEYQGRLEDVIRDLTQSAFQSGAQTDGVMRFVAGEAVRSEILSQNAARKQDTSDDIWNQDESWMQYHGANLAFEDQLRGIIEYIQPKVQARATARQDASEALDQHFTELWDALDLQQESLWYLTQRHFVKQTKDIIFGYGPLEDLLRTPAVSEIMVVDSEHIYIERAGVVQDSGRRFISDEVTCSIIERIVDKVGRQINKSRPLVDARLSDGSRVNAVVAPIAVSGPCLTIRKFPTHRLRLRDLASKQIGAVTHSVRKFMEAAVADHRNILISGGTGTGKTTLLNAFSDVISANERIVTVEDTAELQIGQEHVISLESKEKNIEGKGAYTIRDLVKNALRMRPDRIIVGECRGPEALDMLQAMNTGHDGSMTTIHANTPRDVIARLEVLVQAGNDINLPISSIYQQIVSAIDVIVQLTRFPDGRRRVTQVTEVTGIDPDGSIELRDLFVMGKVQDSKTGEVIDELVPTGRLPTFIHRISEGTEGGQIEDHRGFVRKLDLSSFYV